MRCRRSGRAGDLAQALMDLGATVCTPRSPNCALCPVWDFCEARKLGEQLRFPVKAEKKAVPTRFGSAFVLTRGDQVMLVRRPPSGLLGGMMMPPTSAWNDVQADAPLAEAPGEFKWERVGEVRHVFTHFALRLDVWTAEAGSRARVGRRVAVARGRARRDADSGTEGAGAGAEGYGEAAIVVRCSTRSWPA